MIGKILKLPFVLVIKVLSLIFSLVKGSVGAVFGLIRFVLGRVFSTTIGALAGFLLGNAALKMGSSKKKKPAKK